MAEKYETAVNSSDRNLSHALIVDYVGLDKRVLYLGSKIGYVAKALIRRSCRVTSIEIDTVTAKQAEEHCERTIVGDVESLGLKEEPDRRDRLIYDG